MEKPIFEELLDRTLEILQRLGKSVPIGKTFFDIFLLEFIVCSEFFAQSPKIAWKDMVIITNSGPVWPICWVHTYTFFVDSVVGAFCKIKLSRTILKLRI
jgi:hypothetical protein